MHVIEQLHCIPRRRLDNLDRLGWTHTLHLDALFVLKETDDVLLLDGIKRDAGAAAPRAGRAASKHRTRPERKLSMTVSRWFCATSPCSKAAPIPAIFSSAANSSHSLFVPVNTRVLPKAPAYNLQRSPIQSP